MFGRQLKAQAAAVRVPSKRQVHSLLFGRDAADLDSDSIFAIGCNGLAGLVMRDETFAVFEHSLFSEAMKSADRNLMNARENDELNKTIESFMMLASSHFLNEATMKALEWLALRFRVHQHNVDAIMKCILPYHDTKQFVEVVAVLDISTHPRWSFLMFVQKTAVPLTRANLVKRIGSDTKVFAVICEMVESTLTSKSPNANAASFLAALMNEILEKGGDLIYELQVTLLPLLLKMIASAHRDFQASAFIIIASASKQVTFASDFVDLLVTAVMGSTTKSLYEEAICCVMAVAEARDEPLHFPKKVGHALTGKSPLWDAILRVVSSAGTHHFLLGLFGHLVDQYLAASDANDRSAVNARVISLVERARMSPDVVGAVAEIILGLAAGGEGNKERMAFVEKIIRALCFADSGVASVRIVEGIKRLKEGSRQREALLKMTLSALQGSIHQPLTDLNSTLFLSLHHPEAHVRLVAFERLKTVLLPGSGKSAGFTDHSSLPELLLGGVRDEDDAVVRTVLSMDHVMRIRPDVFLPELVRIVTDSPSPATQQAAIIRLLRGVREGVFKMDANLMDVLFAFLLVTYERRSLWPYVIELMGSGTFPVKAIGAAPNALKTLVTELAAKDHSFKDSSRLAAEALSIFVSDSLASRHRGGRILAGLIVRRMSAIQGATTAVQLKIVVAAGARLSGMRVQRASALTGLMTVDFASVVKDGGSNAALEFSLLVDLICGALGRCGPVVAGDWLADANDAFVEKRALVTAFDCLSRAPAAEIVSSALIHMFRAILRSQALPFLAGVWIDQDLPAVTRVKALETASSLLVAYAGGKDTWDFQVILPSVFIALADTNKGVRGAAVKCIRAALRNYNRGLGKPSKNVFAHDSFYGAQTENVKFMTQDLILRLISLVVDSGEEIFSEQGFFQRLLVKTLQQKEGADPSIDNILISLLSHILVIPRRSAKVAILDLLKPIDTPLKLRTLRPLFTTYFNEEKAAGAPSPDDSGVRMHLLDCFSPVSITTIFASKSGRFLPLFTSIISFGSADESIKCLGLIRDSWFAALPAKQQEFLVTAILDAVIGAGKEVSQVAREVLYGLTLPAGLLVNALKTCEMRIREISESGGVKRARADSDNKGSYYRLATILELIEAESVKLSSMGDLIGPVFDILQLILGIQSDATPVSPEYLKQLCVSAELKIVNAVKVEKHKLDEFTVRVDLIVQCIRATDNPQTHNTALLLMSSIAVLYPESVLNSIIPVFTFMGANVLRRDDNYSFHVIQQTLEASIPSLLALIMSIEMKPILDVFINTLFHVPKHRRLKLFIILTSTLGPQEFLHAVILMLFVKMVNRTSEDAAEAQNIPSFCLSLAQYFSCAQQLNAIIAVHKLLKQAITQPPSGAKASAFDLRFAHLKAINLMLGGGSHLSDRARRNLILSSYDFVANLLASRSFVRKFKGDDDGGVGDGAANEANAPLFELVEILLDNILTVHEAVATGTGIGAHASFGKSALKRLNVSLANVIALLPLESFLDLIASMIDHRNPALRRKAITILGEKVNLLPAKGRDDSSSLFHGVFAKLHRNVAAHGDDEGDVTVRQASLICLNSMILAFAKADPALYLSLASALLDEGGLFHADRNIRASSIVCMTSLCQELGARVVPHIPKYVNAILAEIRKDSGDGLADDVVFISALTSIDTVIKTVPTFVSPYIMDVLDVVLSSDSLKSLLQSNASLSSKLNERKRDIMSNLASKVPARVLIPSISGYTARAMARGPGAMLELFEIASMMISHLDKVELARHHGELADFFLSSFDYRRACAGRVDGRDLDKVDGGASSAFTQMVLRLNETLFRPIFFRLVNWATNDIAGKGLLECPETDDVLMSTIAPPKDIHNRQLFFYRLVDSLLGKLKSIISPYFTSVLDHASDLLASYPTKGAIDDLWPCVLSCLTKFFTYNPEPLSIEKFERVCGTVVEQMGLAGAGRVDLEVVIKSVIPCLGQMATNVGKEAAWKTLNKAILEKCRSKHFQVRILSLKALEELYTRLGDEFLVFLPETIPFMAELMEDDNEQVQIACNDTAAEIQRHLGEDINTFFS
ncbi:HEAT repeat-containing protein 1 [Irineochytrium annulatum]|nr:HEAT repeat-containing protein 1 [Irineochytrium annulatum]